MATCCLCPHCVPALNLHDDRVLSFISVLISQLYRSVFVLYIYNKALFLECAAVFTHLFICLTSWIKTFLFVKLCESSAPLSVRQFFTSQLEREKLLKRRNEDEAVRSCCSCVCSSVFMCPRVVDRSQWSRFQSWWFIKLLQDVFLHPSWARRPRLQISYIHTQRGQLAPSHSKFCQIYFRFKRLTPSCVHRLLKTWTLNASCHPSNLASKFSLHCIWGWKSSKTAC